MNDKNNLAHRLALLDGVEFSAADLAANSAGGKEAVAAALARPDSLEGRLNAFSTGLREQELAAKQANRIASPLTTCKVIMK